MKIEPDRIYVPKEVAAILRCGPSSVYELASKGAIAHIRVGAGGGGLRFLGSDILAFLDDRKVEPKPRMNLTRLGL